MVRDIGLRYGASKCFKNTKVDPNKFQGFAFEWE